MRNPEVVAGAILVGTDDGLHRIGGEGGDAELAGRRVVHLVLEGNRRWAVVDPDVVMLRAADGEWTEVGRVREKQATCVLPNPATTASGIADGAGVGEVLVGTSEAHLYRLRDGSAERVESFERVEGREAWFTPWGGPPATRSLAGDPDGAIYVNVHVGGIPKSTDDAQSWQPTVDIRADVHEVRVHPERYALLVAAAAVGFGVSEDAGLSWSFSDEGLTASYARAVAVAGDTVFLTASEGPRGGHAAAYRGSLSGAGAFERCRAGLPEWFARNINTHCLDVGDGIVAFGVEGSVYASSDEGTSWDQAATGLPGVNCLAIP